MRNIKLFYVLRALTLPYLWLPILYFYLTAIKGFSVSQTTILLGLQEFLLIFLEVPTGVIADKISRKFSVALGTAIISIPFAILPFVNSYKIVVILFFVKALGKALVSGADSALLYDTLVDLRRTDEYKKIKTQSAALTMGVTALCIFLGGLLGQSGLYNLTLIIPLPIQLFAAVIVGMMVEPDVSRKAQQIQESNYVKHIWGAVMLVVSNRALIITAIAFSILEGSAVNMKWYYPAIFEHLGFGLGLVGLVMSLLYAGKTLINAIGSKLIIANAFVNTTVWIGIITLAWLGLGTWLVWQVAVITLIIILLGLEVATNSTEELIHDQLKSSVRATAMSFVNLLSSVFATILIWEWGKAIQLGGVISASLLQGLGFLIVMIMLVANRGLFGNNASN